MTRTSCSRFLKISTIVLGMMAPQLSHAQQKYPGFSSSPEALAGYRFFAKANVGTNLLCQGGHRVGERLLAGLVRCEMPNAKQSEPEELRDLVLNGWELVSNQVGQVDSRGWAQVVFQLKKVKVVKTFSTTSHGEYPGQL